jgi:glycosyltransferase involved in cell wall biosynthesis
MESMPRLAFVVNDSPGSALDTRARAFADRLSCEYETRLFHRSRRKFASIGWLLGQLIDFRPDLCYVLDMGYSGVAAAAFYSFLSGRRLVIDTGDAITELAKATGRGRIGLALTRALEWFSLRVADRIVVRGTLHRKYLAENKRNAEVIQDGVDVEEFRAHLDGSVRTRLGLAGVLTVGLVGSCVWNPRTQTCYGAELVETIARLRDLPVYGVLIGDGSGLPVLRERCRHYGIEDRVQFLGRIPYAELPAYLEAMDICLSTQTNDLVGQVRTTGKLPLYLAAGRFVLASNVGEASRVLPPEMLVEFVGRADSEYPARLAERIRWLEANRTSLARGEELVDIARREFDYSVLTARLVKLLRESTPALHRPRAIRVRKRETPWPRPS